MSFALPKPALPELIHGTNVNAILLRLEPDEETFTCRARDVGLVYHHAFGEMTGLLVRS